MKKLLTVFVVLGLIISSVAGYASAATNYSAYNDYSSNTVDPKGSTVPRKAIVVIPGVGGSVLRNSSGQTVWLSDAMLPQLACTVTGTSVNTIIPASSGYGVLSMYETLCTELRSEFSGDAYDVLFSPMTGD